MKPLKFMDALSDINDELIRGMLNDDAGKHEVLDEKKAKNEKNHSNEKSVRIDAITVRDDEEKDDKTIFFIGKLRYLALFVSAAACIALVIGIMRLHPGESEDSFAANSMYTEVQEPQTEPVITVITEAEKMHGMETTKTEATKSSKTTAPVENQAENPVSGEGSGLMTAETANEQTAEFHNSEITSKVTKVTTVSTSTTTTTVPETDNARNKPGDWYQPYTQSHLLGDVDADGDITLIDYFLAAREYYVQVVMQAGGFKSLDADALDRGNVDRIEENGSLISLNDIDDIRYLAILRRWLGFTDMTPSEWIKITYDEEGMFEERSSGIDDCLELFNDIYETDYEQNKDRIVGTMIPQAIRDFYNSAMIQVKITWNESYPSFAFWSDMEFEQKMNELRLILSES